MQHCAKQLILLCNQSQEEGRKIYVKMELDLKLHNVWTVFDFCLPSSGQLQRLILSLLKMPNNIQLLLWSIVPLLISTRKLLKRKQIKRKKMPVIKNPQEHAPMRQARWLLKSTCLLQGRLKAVKVRFNARTRCKVLRVDGAGIQTVKNCSCEGIWLWVYE